MEGQIEKVSFEEAESYVNSLAYSPDVEAVREELNKICPECKEIKLPNYSYGTHEEQNAIMFYSYAKYFPELRKGRIGNLYKNMNKIFALYIKAKHLKKQGKEEELNKVLEEIKELYENVKRNASYLKRRLEFSVMRKSSMGESVSSIFKAVTDDNIDDPAVKQYRKLIREVF